MITVAFEFRGVKLDGEVTHNPAGTLLINSASLEPNDEEEFVLESISGDHLPDEFCEWLMENHADELTDAAYEEMTKFRV